MNQGKLITKYLVCKVETNHLGKANANGLLEDRDIITFIHMKTFYSKQEAIDYIAHYTSYTDFIIKKVYSSVESD